MLMSIFMTDVPLVATMAPVEERCESRMPPAVAAVLLSNKIETEVSTLIVPTETVPSEEREKDDTIVFVALYPVAAESTETQFSPEKLAVSAMPCNWL